ncbi:MAG: beta-ketoacyl-[acyl-carrier-protein] synthase family protein [Planctomycetota bacterium]|nr:MAG: beta-ketoacyl-[acyl-carrier-protein] synthase family protein [Planctomycetota bacterium]REJ93596.1 MAG: beta-ketoacyl-[acyl-carrier-protein] synthase family protein [Planctomycetota bacterium]REK19944.1 MAG: beta-ketoacyl-[acyl-carrier-protein] synthase family protein [Planctomycetota bacterium]REK27510.1 MAG: beta-ketoacyl-[acyl-carrier-protein] synthase family protein [Planctomycetota bacterium]
MRRRVVITGLGCVTPIGSTIDSFWDSLTAGRSGAGPLTVFDASRYPVRIAAEVKNWTLADLGVDPTPWTNAPRQTRFALGSALSATAAAGLPSSRIDPVRFGVYLGCGEAFADFPSFMQSLAEASSEGQAEASRFLQSALRVFDPQAEPEYEPNSPAGHLAALLGAHGPNINCIAACVSSAQAVGQAARMIRRGEVDLMLAGGAHSTIHPFGLTGFHRLSTLSTRNDAPQQANRPFDRDRDGFVIGEGGAAFVLEELDHARSRGAEIWAEVTGYGSAQDAYRITDTHPEGRGTVAAIQRALNDAQLNAESIDYINAHGTGTELNDRIETIAFKKALGDHAWRVPISSTKSMLGHATTACAAIELAVCVLAIRHGAIPPTINLDNPDPDCDLDYVPHTARERNCRHILSDSVGFGGQNAALVVSRFDESSPSTVGTTRAA